MNIGNASLKKIDYTEFESLLDIKASAYLESRIKKLELEYSEISSTEYEELLTIIIKSLMGGNLVKAGEERRGSWESGWKENLDLLTKNENAATAIIPKYFNKYNVVRWNRRFIKPISERFEKSSLTLIVDYIADKYFRDSASVYEFGCGTGHNLFSVREVNPSAKLYGLDWATSSQSLIEELRKRHIDNNIYGLNFDYFNPRSDLTLDKKSAIFTVASLEQVGDQWGKFVDFLVSQKPDICVHIEPIAELLDENVLLDYLSIEYFKKRNYLSGFLTGLIDLEKRKKIEIIDQRRTYIGSLFIEGYSIVVWRAI